MVQLNDTRYSTAVRRMCCTLYSSVENAVAASSADVMCVAAGVCDQHVPAARAADDSAHVDARGGGGARHAAGRVAAALADAEVPLQSGGRVLPVDARYASMLRAAC